MIEPYIYNLYSKIYLTPILSKDRRYRLKNAIEYTVQNQWKPFNIKIHKWFIFDGASIPRIFWAFGTPMDPVTLLAALVHDYLYRYHEVTRQQADEIFNEILMECWVWFIKRNAYYLWVRAWGWITWYFTGEFAKKSRQKDIK